MKIVHDELKLFGVALLVGMIGMQIGFHVDETFGIAIVFICIPIAGYAVIKGQIKFFKKLKSHRDENDS